MSRAVAGRDAGPFLWGAATSSHQIEGGNDKNDWWAWEAQGRVEGGARSGAATDHWNRFREDIRLAAELGLNAYRFSVEWSRLEPERGRHPIELVLSRVFHRFYNRAWLDAVTGRKQRFGVLGLVPSAQAVPEALGRRTVNFIGINYYTKAYLQWRPRGASEIRPGDLPIGISFARRKEPASDLGWAIHPGGFGKMLRLASRYGLPVYVTENGIADRGDARRSRYLLSHLGELSRAIASGVDVRGYFHWSLMDNFEWIKGFGPRFGLYRVDYETFERTPTGSATLYRKIIEAHRARARMLPDPAYFCCDR